MNARARAVLFSSACERASLRIVLGGLLQRSCVSVKCPRSRGCPRPPQCGQTDGFVRLDNGLVFPNELAHSEFFEFSRARFKGKSGRLKAPKAKLIFFLVAEQRFSNVICLADQDMMFEIVNAVDAGDWRCMKFNRLLPKIIIITIRWPRHRITSSSLTILNSSLTTARSNFVAQQTRSSLLRPKSTSVGLTRVVKNGQSLTNGDTKPNSVQVSTPKF